MKMFSVIANKTQLYRTLKNPLYFLILTKMFLALHITSRMAVVWVRIEDYEFEGDFKGANQGT